MRQKIVYVFKCNLLTALLLIGVICCAVGITWCRYQKTIDTPVSFIIEGPGNFVILGSDDATSPEVWHEDKDKQTTQIDFRVANGVKDAFPEEDGVFHLRLLATEGIPAGAEVFLAVTDEQGIRQTYPIHAEQISFEGKYLELCNEMGDGTRYRFMDGGRELVLKLAGGKRSILKCSIVVKGNVEPFLAELQLIDAAYGNAADVLTSYIDKTEEKSSYLLAQWESGEEAPQTELLLSTVAGRTEGKLMVRTDSNLVSPNLEMMETTDTPGDKGTIQELEVVVEPNKAQRVKMALIPDETLLKDMTDPVKIKADVTWSFTNEAGEVEELAVELITILNPSKVLIPSEPNEESTEVSSEPSEEGTETSSEPSEESAGASSEPSEPSEESTEASSEPSESSVESTEASSEPSESSEESTETSSEPSESSTSTESSENDVSSEEVAEEDVVTFTVKKENGKHQMELTGLVQKLSLTESIAGQVTYIGEEIPTTSQQLQELHIVSHLASWEFNIHESNLVLETTVEGLTSEGYQAVKKTPTPHVIIFDVTEGEYKGGKNITIQGNNALAGTYRLILTHKTKDNFVVHTEYIPIFVNYRFEDILEAAVQEK